MTIRDIFINFGYQIDKKTEKSAESSIQGLKSMATKLLGAIGVGFSLGKLRDIAEEFNGINDTLNDATRGMGDQLEIQRDIVAAANDARMHYGDMADHVAKLAQNRDVFSGVEDAANFASLMSKNFMATGKSAEESAALMKPITTALNRGKLDSRALMSIMRESPSTMRMLAESIGVSTERFQEMATKGEISANQLKAAFEQNAESIQARYGELDFSISDAMLSIRNSWGLWVDQMNSTLGITQTIARGMVVGFEKVMSALKRMQGWFQRVAEKVGGTDKLLRILVISAGAVLVALNAAKIMAFFTSVIRMLNLANLKALAIVAAIALVALLIEDFVAFMRGDDSLLGEVFENLGIDADAVREKIKAFWEWLKEFWDEHGAAVKDSLDKVWEGIKGALKAAWGAIKRIAIAVWDAIEAFWEKHGEDVERLFSKLWEGLKRTFGLFVDEIVGALDIFAAIFRGDWEGLWEAIKNQVEIKWEQIKNVFNVVYEQILFLLAVLFGTSADEVDAWFADIKATFSEAADFIEGIIEPALTALKEAMEKLMPAIELTADVLKNVFGAAIEGLRPIVDAFISMLEGLIDFIAGAFTGDWERAWQGVVDIFKNLIGGLWAIVKLPLNQIIAGINTVIRGLNGVKVPDWVPGLGGKGIAISEIPRLADGGYVKRSSPRLAIIGDNNREGEIVAPESKIYSVMVDALQAFAARLMPQQAAMAIQSAEAAKHVTQNVNITNQFHGDRAGQQKSAAAMEAATEDATAMLARALAYAV